MSIVLNGTTQYAYRTAPVANVAPFSVFGYFKSTSDSALQAIWGEGDKDTIYDFWTMRLRGSVVGDPVGCYVRRSSVADATTSTGYTINTWQNALFIEAGAQDHKIYLNGDNEGSDTSNSVAPVNEDRMSIGALAYNGSWVNFFAGKLAEVCVWNIALSAEDRASLSGGATPSDIQAGNIIAYYPLRENANDASGNGLHLTTVASPTFDTEDHPIEESSSLIIANTVNYYNNLLCR